MLSTMTLSFSISIQQIIVCGVTLALIVLLFSEKIRPAFLFFTAVLVFLLTGIINIEDFLEALANESILSIFLLIFITTGIKTHFNLIGWLDRLFVKAKNGKNFMLRMTTSVAGASAVLNNTPIVALFLPYVYQWSRKHRSEERRVGKECRTVSWAFDEKNKINISFKKNDYNTD